MKCPKCNVELTFGEVIEFEPIYDDTIIELVWGKCETCGCDYIWDRIYKLHAEENLKVDE